MEELMENVTLYAESLEVEEIKKAVSNILKRAKLCVEVGGGAFEYKLKKSQRSRGHIIEE